MSTRKSPRSPFVRSLERGLSILRLVATSKQPVTLSELAELLHVDRSSALRLAHTLRRQGFLSCPPGRKDYVLGSAIWTLSRQYDWSNMLVKVAHSELNRIATQINETAHLAIREGKSVLFIDSAHTTNALSVAGRTGELAPLYCTAHGKALLGDLNEKEIWALFGDGSLPRYTRNTIVGIKALVKECATIQEKGYATDMAEFEGEVCCVAVPIRIDKEIVGSIGVSAPASRFSKSLIPVYAKELHSAAKRIGSSLGQSEPIL